MIKLLIVGTVPYNTQSPSRAFDSYFHGWPSADIAQIFSNSREPVKGHCDHLYQITDQRMVRRWFNRTVQTGVTYRREELSERYEDSHDEKSSNAEKKLKKIGATNKSALMHMARKVLWRKRFWCTKELHEWIEHFKPECVFLAFSDDFFILDIAIYIAEKYKIPIVSCIGDDYYFNYSKTLSPVYHLYKWLYRKKVREVFSHKGTAAYIGDKIRDKYNKEFGLDGETVYLTSTIQNRAYQTIDTKKPKIRYFGNLLLGRNKSIVDIAEALEKVDKDYYIDVYSNDTDISAWGIFEGHKNIHFHGSVPYTTVQAETLRSDILLVVEGFDKVDVDITRYSLSTKVADSLSSGVSVFGYGSIECGAIEYLQSVGCAEVCIDKTKLVDSLKHILYHVDVQQANYNKAIQVVEKNHRLTNSTRVFHHLVEKVCQ